METSTQANHKFRPLLNLEELDFILAAVNEATESAIKNSLLRKLTVFRFKAGLGANTPAYVATPKDTQLSQFEQIASEEEIAAYLEAELGRKLATNSEI